MKGHPETAARLPRPARTSDLLSAAINRVRHTGRPSFGQAAPFILTQYPRDGNSALS